MVPPSSKPQRTTLHDEPLANGGLSVPTAALGEGRGAILALIGGRWRLEGRLGRGGMSEVFRAHDENGSFGAVALKLVGTSESSFARRLAEEARALESFDHPNLVRLLDAGVYDGQAYLVTELVEGPTLAHRLREGPLSPERTAALAAALADALAYVHERGMVHRDVKPANVLLGPAKRVRLADFGIARLVDSASMTMTGTTLGTAAYMAPEQIEHHSVGTAADVWSLGLTLLECLLGARVFEGTPSEVVARRLAGSLQPPPDLPMPWRLVLSAMLDPAADRRPSASEVAGMVAGPAFKVGWQPKETTSPLIVPIPRAGAEPVDETVPQGMLEEGEPPTSVMPAPGASGRARGTGAPERTDRVRWLDRRLVPLAAIVAIAIALALWAASGPDPARAAKGHNDPSTTLRHATTTTTSTTTTTVPTTATTSAALVRDVQNGISQGSVGQDVGAQILHELDQVLMAADQNWGSATVGNDLGQIDALIADGASSSSITPTEASILTTDVAALAGALGATTTTTTTAAPPPSTDAPAPSAPGPPGGGGPGHHGQGQGG